MGLGSWVIYLDKGPLLMIFASTRPFYGLWVLPNLEIYLIFWWIIILFLLLLLFIDIPVSLPNSLPSRYIANKIFPRVKMRIVASIFKVSAICAAHFHPLNWLTDWEPPQSPFIHQIMWGIRNYRDCTSEKTL